MTKILVEVDWGKEADENPFPSGGMINVDGEMVYIFVGHSPTASPTSTNREWRPINKKKADEKYFFKKPKKTL